MSSEYKRQMLAEVNPLNFNCLYCKKSTKSIGMQWSCGHTSCCQLSDEVVYCCFVPGCQALKYTRSGWYRNPSDNFRTRYDFEENYPAARPCPRHPNRQPYLSVILGSSSPISPKGHCGDCLIERGVPIHRFISDFAANSFRNLVDFRNSYNRFDRTLSYLQMDLSFRGEMDHLVAELVLNFSRLTYQDILEHKGTLKFSRMSFPEYAREGIVEDGRLAELRDLLQRLVDALGQHSQQSILNRIADFLARHLEGEWESPRLVTQPAQPAEITIELRTLFAKDWPIYSKTIASVSYSKKIAKPRLAKSKNQPINFLRASRAFCKSLVDLARQSSIFHRRHIPALSTWIEPQAHFTRLPEMETLLKRSEKVNPRSINTQNLVVFVKTPTRSFGFFAANGSVLFVNDSDASGTFLFSLDTGRVFGLRDQFRLVPRDYLGNGFFGFAPEVEFPQRTFATLHHLGEVTS